MRIGLIDLDSSHFPNIPLMKISAWHKSQGDSVEFYDPLFSDYMDIVYVAKVFTWTKDFDYEIRADQIIKGGIGYGIENENKLPEYIEKMFPDYSLYGTNSAYGFLTRGCPRNCSFCNVSKHQGYISHKVADLNSFWNGQKEIVLLDPNILACRDWKPLLQQLIDSRAWIDFTQGLDIRMMTDEKVDMLNQMKIKMIHFAWDQYSEHTFQKLKEYRSKFRFRGRELRVFVLVNYDTTIEQDLDRIYRLRELDYDPYVMVYDKKNAPKKINALQRWVNNKIVWRTVKTFEEYTRKELVKADSNLFNI